MSVAKVMKMVKDNDIKFVDFRFTFGRFSLTANVRL